MAEAVDRMAFVTNLGGACLCAAVGGMRSAFAEEPPATPKAAPPDEPTGSTKPGEKTVARSVKRMEFVDGWVERFFTVVDQTLDEPTRQRLLTANGRACFLAWAKDAPKRPEPASLETISAWVARAGKGHGYSMDGNTIAFEYVGSAETGQAAPENVCLCPTVEAQSSRTISATYCHCSVGYVQEMHERRFGRPVKVELVSSVLRGGPRCRFRITVA